MTFGGGYALDSYQGALEGGVCAGPGVIVKGAGVPVKCVFVPLAQWNYIKAVDNPCDSTKAGRAIRELLGAACEQKMALSASDEIYTRYQRCGSGDKERGLASNGCEEKFESQ